MADFVRIVPVVLLRGRVRQQCRLATRLTIEISSRSTACCHALDFECVAIVQSVIAWALLEGCLLKWPIFVNLVAMGRDVPTEDVDDDVQIVIGPLRRSQQFSDVPTP